MVVLACRTCCVAIMLTCLVRSAAGQISDAPADVAGTYSALAEEGGSEDLPEDSGRVAGGPLAGPGQQKESAKRFARMREFCELFSNREGTPRSLSRLSWSATRASRAAGSTTVSGRRESPHRRT